MADQQDDRISHFINREGIKEDKDYIISALNQIKQTIIDMDKVKTSLFGTNTIAQAIRSLNELTNAQKKLHEQELKVVQLAIANENVRLKQAQILLAEAKATDVLANAQKKQAQTAKLTEPKVKASGGSVDDSAFEILRKQAKQAKDEFNSLIVEQNQGLAVSAAAIDNAKNKWKGYQQQLQAVALQNKTAFDPEKAAQVSARIQVLKGQVASLQAPLESVKQKLLTLGKTDAGRKSAEFERLTQEAAQYTVQLSLAEKELAQLSKAEKERQQIASQSGKIADNIDKEIAAGKELNSFYNELLLKLQALQEQGRELAAKGLTQGLSDVETKKLAELQTSATDLSNAIAKIDNQLGKGARSNLAYTQQLFSLQQVLRETPNIAFGWNIFLASLSNNIPILADDIKRLSERNKELQAAGKPTTSVLKQVGNSLLSFTSVIAIAVALLTIFSDKIVKWARSLFLSAEANRRAFLASKEYIDLLKLQEQTVSKLIDAYNKLALVVGKSNQQAINDLKRQLSALESLGVSADKLFGLKEKINNLDIEQSKRAFETSGSQLRDKAQADVVLAQKTIEDLSRRRQLLQIELSRLQTTPTAGLPTDSRPGRQKKIAEEIAIINKSIIEEQEKGQKELTKIRLSDEEIIAKTKLENEEQLFRRSATLQRQLNELRTDVQIKKQSGEDAGMSKEEIERLQSLIDISKTQVEEAQKQFDNLLEVENKFFDARAEAERIANEKRKFYSDQARRTALSDIKQVTDETIKSNQFILDSDRSSQQQRLDAIDNIADAKFKAAQADRDFILTDIGRTNADVIEAENTFTNAILDLEIERSQGRTNVIQDFLSRNLEAKQSALEAEKGFTIRINDEITESINVSLQQRTKALQKSFDEQRKLLDSQTGKELTLAGLNPDEIKTFLETGKVEVADKKKTLDELLAIRTNYEVHLRELILGFTQGNAEVLIKELARQRQIIEESTGEISTDLETILTSQSKAADEELIKLRELFKTGQSGIVKFSTEQVKLFRAVERQRLKEIADSIDKEILLYQDATANKIASEKRYKEAKEALLRATTDEQLSNSLKELELAKDSYDQALEFYNKLLELLQKLQEARKNQRTQEDTETEQDLTAEMQMWELRFQLMQQINDFGKTVLESQHQRRLTMIDEETEALEKRAERERQIVEQTVTDEETKQKRLREIDLRAENQRAVLEARRRKLERDKAIADKISASSAILIDLAKTITQINFRAAILALTNPLLAKLALAEIPFVIGQSVLGLASIAAQPLPKLAEGSDDFPGGYAITGDANKHELVIEPDGRMYVTGNTPEVRYIKQHSVVMPDAQKAMDQMMTMAKVVPDQIINTSISPTVEVPGFDRLDHTMKSGFHLLVKTIRNKPTAIFNRGINKELLLKYGSDYQRFI